MKTVLFGLVATGVAAAAAPEPMMTDCMLKDAGSPFKFTSTFHVDAGPGEVVDAMNNFTGGLQGATGHFHFGINSDQNFICYNISVDGFRGNYSSPAKTATHIHEGAVGKSGPPRIVFPNPEGPEGQHRVTMGCIQGPFVTGVMTNGTDSGRGFHVRQIEENPDGFFADLHSTEAVPGAVRGQLQKQEVCTVTWM
ncbi:hypothetical protein XA68_14766 [Ophiocordyceps unilateralis]|uniref:CHRD domain-containing protein n=1 Tax=Ophiocordyceps unilateralis TaxID=268505 RepID=A0A2A9P9F5_OPHUN|nr:hypothetical protein XA68_14766 [Ophiocordyceps unilateralis]